MKSKLILQTDAQGISPWALAAKNIRTELREAFPGVKFSVTSDCFSMGNSVDVSWSDGPTCKEVDAIIEPYEYGTFDGMTDCQGVKHNDKHRFGSAKYVKSSRNCSVLIAQIEEALKPFFPPADHYQIFHHENLGHRMACRISLKPGQKFVGVKRREEVKAGQHEDFWEVLLSDMPAEVQPMQAGQVIKTKHTQKGFDLFVVQLPERVSREAFQYYLGRAKMLGGWYSSYAVGGAVPGFQFKLEEAATAFLGIIAKPETAPAVEASPVVAAVSEDHKKQQAEKLRALADGMEKTIESKLNSATSQQNPTPRRLRIAEGMRADGRALQRVQAALRRIAEAMESNQELPFEFLSLRWSKSVVAEALHGRGLPALVEWLKTVPKVEEDPAKKRIREIEESFVGQKMPGYFPTPPELVSRMLNYLPDRACLVLEPSAGSGAIACAVNHGSTVHCCEIRPALAELLKLKGQKVIAGDFMDYKPGAIYDAVVMNPPFENSQACAHILHAWECLKPGGRLVAIAPESIMFRDSPDYNELRDWIETNSAEIEDVEAGAFEKSGTMVKTRMIIATKG